MKETEEVHKKKHYNFLHRELGLKGHRVTCALAWMC